MVDALARLSGSIVKIIVLIWADMLAAFVLWVMMTYLTDVWKMNFTHAAAIINIYRGASSILPLGFSILVDTLIGNYWMLLLSSVAYSIGLSFLSMSTPPVLSKATGTCSTYEPACIGEVQKILFYTALALIAVGLAGHLVSLISFIEQQVLGRRNDEIDTEEESVKQRVYAFVGFFAVILALLVCAVVLSYTKPWSVRFGLPAVCTVVATVVFISGSGSYAYVKPAGSSFTRLFRVFVASAIKIHIRPPKDPAELYEKNDNDDSDDELVLPHTPGLRCLDKAAIFKSSQTLEDQEKNRWMLCRVTEVEETKIIIRMIPMWITFIAIGLVMSIGNTFFLEQANRMNPKVGKLKVPLPMFLAFYETASSQGVSFYYKMANSLSQRRRKYAPAIGIALAMVLAILCCITAAKIEERRIDVVRKHDLIDKPKDTIPMTIFWLLPQFLLLGGLEGLASGSVVCFFRDQVYTLQKNLSSFSSSSPSSMTYSYFNFVSYMNSFILFTMPVFGVGRVCAVLSVYVVGKVSQHGGKPSWFGNTLNKSRLDKYYWTLAALSAINLLLYALIAMLYTYRDSYVEEEEPPEDEDTGNFDEADCCCCCC